MLVLAISRDINSELVEHHINRMVCLQKRLVRINPIETWWNGGIKPLDPERFALQEDLVAITPPRVLRYHLQC